MQRTSLITEIRSGTEFTSCDLHLVHAMDRWTQRSRRRHWALLVGALLMATGCQSSSMFSRFTPKPKSEDLSPEQKKSVLAILDKKSDKNEAGLPNATKSKTNGEGIESLLDKGESALAAYYKDSSSAHLTEAHRCYEQVLAQDPGNADSHHGLAIVCDLQKDFTSAELHYRAALEKDPNNGRVLGDLGYSYLLQNKLSEAERTLVQATKLDPQNNQAYKNLGYVYAKQGNYNLAESTFRRAMNDAEVRQELAQLFPQGRPDMAKSGEPGKSPWNKKDGITTDEFAKQMADAREQSLAEMKEKQRLLDASSAQGLSLEQQRDQLVQLAKERDAANRNADLQAAQSNTPLVLGPPPGPNPSINPGYVNPGNGGYPNMVQNQFAGLQQGAPNPSNSPNGARYQRPTGAPPNNGMGSSMAASGQPPMSGQGRRVTNAFYPNQGGNPNQWGPRAGEPNGYGVEQASGFGEPRANEQALHQTNRGLDPRTGMPLREGIQQIDGQAPLLVPGNYGNPSQGENGFGPTESANPNSPMSQNGSFEEAKRRAALAGMGGPEMMFPQVNMPQVDGGNRLSPGTGSTWNGGQYPQPTRMLPMDAAPHDLDALSNLPSGQMTVQPNNMGMLNSPTGRSFSNPNFGQPLNPQIPLESPLGNQGTNYQDQAYPNQGSRQQFSGTSSNPYEAARNSDPRNGLNADLQQYGQTTQFNPAQNNQNAWNHVANPGAYAPPQPQVGNPSQLMNSGWNQQQLNPRITTPPPYSSRNIQTTGNANSAYGNYGGTSDSAMQGGYSDDSGYGAGQSYSSEPAPIYSPGIRVPAAYNGGNTSRPSGPYGQGYDGPRITPAGR